MNQKNNALLPAEQNRRTRIKHYAPVASTHGDKVKIYRYGFDRISDEYRQRLTEEQAPLQRAIIRYEWASFILNHTAEYSGDRAAQRLHASLMLKNARMDVERLFAEANTTMQQARKRLHQAYKRHGFHLSEQGRFEAPNKGLTAATKREIEDLKYDLRVSTNRLNELKRICPERIYEQIIRMDELYK